MNKRLVTVITSISLALVTGCSTTKPNHTEVDALVVDGIIAEKTTEAVEAQERFAQLMVDNKTIMINRQRAFDVDVIDIDYIGQPQELLRTLAYRYGYTYLEGGITRKTPNINIIKRNIRPQDALQSIGISVDRVADVTLNKQTKVIRFDYKAEK